jgi:rare lipoprotein A
MRTRLFILTLTLSLGFNDVSVAASATRGRLLSNRQVKRNVGPNPFSFLNAIFQHKRTTSQNYHVPDSYVVRGKKYQTMKSAAGYKERGSASWYRSSQKTSSGERYNRNAMTAAHRTLPMQTRVLVKNLKNGRSVVVRINDRGPFYSNRLIDLSYAAARQLGLFATGTAVVELQVVTKETAVAAYKIASINKSQAQNQAKFPVKRSVQQATKVKSKAIAKPKPALKSKSTAIAKSKLMVKSKPKVMLKFKPPVQVKTKK